MKGSQGYQCEHHRPHRLSPPPYGNTEVVCDQESAVSAYQGQHGVFSAQDGEGGWVPVCVVEECAFVSGEARIELRAWELLW